MGAENFCWTQNFWSSLPGYNILIYLFLNCCVHFYISVSKQTGITAKWWKLPYKRYLGIRSRGKTKQNQPNKKGQLCELVIAQIMRKKLGGCPWQWEASNITIHALQTFSNVMEIILWTCELFPVNDMLS